ncbi:dihydroorotase [Pelistega indica]|uniref:Dihydroorotase n=2 Tax=Alcaligenaceae TaxID=506 RepID=V8G8Q2_9BURK|nr:dihydroorotase [Pelistega indica]
MAQFMQLTEQTITFIRPDDWHLHLRDGEALSAVLKDTARQFARAIVMPNLKPPVTTVELAKTYRDRILQVMKQQNISGFEPLMTLYLTNNTSIEEVLKVADSGFVKAFKLYPAGATTNSDAGVTDLLGNCSAVLEMMQEKGVPLLVHGEVTDITVDLFDREAVFIDRVMLPLRKRFPTLKVVFEHITTKHGAQYVRDAEGPIGATITPQHLLYNRNAIFQGGIRPHYYCLPVLKREEHRLALVEAATSGNKRFFLGTDSAPHAKGAKEAACGCAGCYSALHALELYATAFEKAGKLDQLEGFASLNGPAFYGLPINKETVTLKRQAFTIPDELGYADGQRLVPLAAGESLAWSFEN